MSNNDWESGYTGSGSGYGPEWEMGRLDRERNNKYNLERAKYKAQINTQGSGNLASGTRSSSDTMGWMTVALFLASMGGFATHHWWGFWWGFAATFVAFALVTFASQKFFVTSTGQKVAGIFRYILFVVTIVGILVFSFMQWSWDGLKWSAIVITSLAVISGLSYFFTETETGDKVGKFIIYFVFTVIAIIFIYAVVTE